MQLHMVIALGLALVLFGIYAFPFQSFIQGDLFQSPEAVVKALITFAAATSENFQCRSGCLALPYTVPVRMSSSSCRLGQLRDIWFQQIEALKGRFAALP